MLRIFVLFILFYMGYGQTRRKPITRPTEGVTQAARQTTAKHMYFEENCDYAAVLCLKAHKTGRLCARTIYYQYLDFENYCMVEFVNCMEKFVMFEVLHMGKCFETPLADYDFHTPWYGKDDHHLSRFIVTDIIKPPPNRKRIHKYTGRAGGWFGLG